MLFKVAVDHMAMGSQAVGLAGQAILLSGVCKAVSGLANEGRAMAFTPVAQDAGRKVALSIFSHILSLDIEFHMARRTVRRPCHLAIAWSHRPREGWDELEARLAVCKVSKFGL